MRFTARLFISLTIASLFGCGTPMDRVPEQARVSMRSDPVPFEIPETTTVGASRGVGANIVGCAGQVIMGRVASISSDWLYLRQRTTGIRISGAICYTNANPGFRRPCSAIRIGELVDVTLFPGTNTACSIRFRVNGQG